MCCILIHNSAAAQRLRVPDISAFEVHETPAVTKGRDPAWGAKVGTEQKVGRKRFQS